MKKLFYTLIFFTAAASIALNLTAEKLIFYPKKDYWRHSLPFEEVSFPAAGGAILHGLYLPPADYMDTILFFHGNAGNATYFEDFAEVYRKYGYGILIFDYRGFGRSEGKITRANIYADGIAAANYLIKERKTAPANIILWGYSFGCAPAINAAAQMADIPFKALILQSPFTNIPHMTAALAGGGYAPDSLLQKTIIGALHVILFNKSYDNLARIAAVKTPMLIGYGEQDSLIPWQMSAALAASAPAGTKSYLSPFGKHGDFAWFEKEAMAFIVSR